MPLRFWLPAYSAKPVREGSSMAEAKKRREDSGSASQQAAVIPAAVPAMVAAARHSRRMRKTASAIAGVSLKEAATAQRTPRSREDSGTARTSRATSAMRTALTCPS